MTNEWLIASDIDGTALIASEGIPPQNIEAAERFVAGGGKFTFATGRSPTVTRLASRYFPVNAPMILLNGAILYDSAENRILSEHSMTNRIRKEAEELSERLDGEAGVILVTRENYYVVSQGEVSRNICRWNYLVKPSECRADEVPGTIYKVLISSKSEEDTAPLRKKVGEWFDGEYNVMRSGERFVELLPKGVSKGSALRELAERLGLPQTRIAAIGDNENDLEMLRFAGASGAPSDAQQTVRDCAARVLGPCMSGALADFIGTVESGWWEVR